MEPVVGKDAITKEKVYRVAMSQIRELVAVIVSAVLYPLAVFKTTPKHMERGKPILLVHGYLHNKTAWTYHKRKLEEAGYGPIYTPNLSQPFASIEIDLAEQVRLEIAKIKEETGADAVQVITHSMGGVVGLETLRSKDLEMEIPNLIMLVPPLGGSSLLRPIQLGECRKEMLPESELLKKIREEVLHQTDLATKIRSLASSVDGIVSKSSATIDATRTDVIDDLGHLGPLGSPEVAEWILSILKENPEICEEV